jgi:type II secretory pathway component GspD/PulD (secretin)
MVEARVYDITTTEGFEMGVEWVAGRHTPLTTFEDATRDFTRTDTTTSRTEYADQEATWDDQGEWDQHRDYLAGDDGSIDGVAGDGDGTASDPGITEYLTPELQGFTIIETETIKEEDTSWFTDSSGELAPYRKSKPFVGAEFTQDGGGALKFGLMNDMIDLEIVLTMLKSEIEATLLANPRVLVLDNETATIKIVTEIPYTQSLRSVGTAASIATVQFKDVGVLLQVTPHIAREGMIRLKLKPEFGVLAEGVNVLDKAAQAPAVNTRVLETTALVKDGQTVVMGGLRKKESSTELSKVPLLGDLPLLGGLFRFETESEVTNEMVVFITPSVVKKPELSDVEERQLKITRFPSPGMSKAGTKRENPPDIGSDKTDVAGSVEPEKG